MHHLDPAIPRLLLPGVLALLIAASAALPATAQDGATLTGRVLDAATGAPLPGANVFLAHTLRGTSTDSAGVYRIAGVAPGAYELVVSIVGYHDQALPLDVRPADRLLTQDVRLAPAVYELDAVEVTARPPRRWRQRYAEFEALFLGPSPNAAQTEILNPYVLDFERSNLGNVLTATAAAPLQIENHALGYRLTFQLERFEWDRKARLLTYSGRPRFEEMTPQSPEQAARWAEARAQTYLGSLRHLLRALAHDRVEQEHFQVMEDFTRERTDIETDAYYVTDVIEVKPITRDDVLFPRETPGAFGLSFEGYLRVVYTQHRHGWTYRRDWKPDEQVSWLKMNTLLATIYEDGYLFPPGALQVHGAMADERVADLLPREYTLAPENQNEP
ncbi:hypothetical protein AWN76_007010 [Rhodothermaceae bacterium RA]|nr:hypothetical protein AWN76_007010 [Rhodothermaceae bacterium RA]